MKSACHLSFPYLMYLFISAGNHTLFFSVSFLWGNVCHFSPLAHSYIFLIEHSWMMSIVIVMDSLHAGARLGLSLSFSYALLLSCKWSWSCFLALLCIFLPLLFLNILCSRAVEIYLKYSVELSERTSTLWVNHSNLTIITSIYSRDIIASKSVRLSLVLAKVPLK